MTKFEKKSFNRTNSSLTLPKQVYEEVVLPDGTTSEFIDVAEVEVGDGRSASPVKIGSLTGTKNRRRNKAPSASLPAQSHSPVISE